jgi:hypothetical protein
MATIWDSAPGGIHNAKLGVGDNHRRGLRHIADLTDIHEDPTGVAATTQGMRSPHFICRSMRQISTSRRTSLIHKKGDLVALRLSADEVGP